jgi:transcriptional regulator with XRE-family HTH domain
MTRQARKSVVTKDMKGAMKTMSPRQCRAARGLLKWTQPKLAEVSGIGLSTINRYENETRPPRPAAVVTLQSALEAAGIEFIFPGESGGGAGVRLK